LNTEYSIGNIRIRFESRARRRWLVVLVYAVLGFYDVAWVPVQGRAWLVQHAGWFVFGLLILIVALLIVFSWLVDDRRMRRDERETYRHEHARARAYRTLGTLIAPAFTAFYLFGGPNPITPHLPLVVRPFFMQLPYVLLTAILFLYITLPQAILLWTEPDMEEQS